MRYNKKDDDFEDYEEDLFIATKAFSKLVNRADQSVFSRRLANKTAGMEPGEIRTINMYCPTTGYMKGFILSSELTDSVAARRERGERFLNGTYRTGKNTVAKTDRVSSSERGYVGDIRVLENGGATIQDAGLPLQQSESEQSGDFAPIRRDLSGEETELIFRRHKEFSQEMEKRFSHPITEDGT